MAPKPGKGGSTRTTATASREVTEELQNFLGDLWMTGEKHGNGETTTIEVNLKLLRKNNETTVLKALAELNREVASASEEDLLLYLPQIIESIMWHAEDANPSIRTGIFTLLHKVMTRSDKAVKVVSKRLPKLAPVWLARMNDMEPFVCKSVRETFDTFYGVEVLRKHADVIVDYFINRFDEVTTQGQGKQSRTDISDSASNVLYSIVCAMGYMLRINAPASAERKVIEFVERGSLEFSLPSREGSNKRGPFHKAMVMASAVPLLLRDIITSNLQTPGIQQQIYKVVCAIIDTSSTAVLRRAWELLLLWISRDSENALSFIQESFLSAVMNSFSTCNDSEKSEIIYPSLVPFLAPVTRSSKFHNAIEKFSVALQKKLLDIGNMIQQVWLLVLTALTNLWELRCVRSAKLGAGHEHEGAEMFSSIVVTVARALSIPTQQASPLRLAASAVAQGLSRIARHGECFSRCVFLLCGPVDCLFNSAPAMELCSPTPTAATTERCDNQAAVLENLGLMQAAIVGYAVQLPGLLDQGERLITQCSDRRQWDVVEELLRSWVEVEVKVGGRDSKKDNTSVCAVGKETQQHVIKCVLETIESIISVETEEECTHQLSSLREVVQLVLEWNDSESIARLQQMAERAEPQLKWVIDSLRAHDLREPNRLYNLFLKACKEADFTTLNLCVKSLSGAQSVRILTSVEKEELKEAVQESLRATLLLVSTDGNDDETHTGGSSENESSKCDTGGSGGSDGDEDSGTEEDDMNEHENDSNSGTLAQMQLSSWAGLLKKGEPFSSLLEVSSDDIDLTLLFRAVASIAPRLHAEQYMSIKALRIALQVTDDPLLEAMSNKTHSIGTKAFNVLVGCIEELLDSYNITMEERDTISLELFDSVMSNPRGSIAACGKLSHLVPFASSSLLRGIACSCDIWSDHQIRLRENITPTRLTSVSFALLDCFSPLSHIEPSVVCCVRTSQLIHLLADCVKLDHVSTPVVAPTLLRAARVREVLAESARNLLIEKLLPRVLSCMTSHETVKSLLVFEDSYKLLYTFAGVIRETALSYRNDDGCIASIRCIVSSVTQWIVEAVLLREVGAPAHEEAISYYRGLFAVLDEASDIVGSSFLSTISSNRVLSSLLESMLMLPTLQPSTALLTVTLHRHLEQLPVVSPDTVRQIIGYAKQKRPADGVELLAELTSSRIVDVASYNELLHVLVNLFARSFRLRHMPPNNYLVSQAVKDEPVALADMQRVVVSAVSALRGVNLHRRVSDSLRGSVNLILFDTVAECVVSLRQAGEEELLLMTKLTAYTSNCLSELSMADVSALRASETSVMRVAAVMNYAYQWLCATSIARLDSMGMDTVTSAIRAVALLSNLTLMRSDMVLAPVMQQIVNKRSLKAIRTEFSSQSPMKIKVFVRQSLVISKTSKQKLSLFPYLLAWCVILSGSNRTTLTTSWREEILCLLDLLCSLLLTSAVPGSKRIESTYLCIGSGKNGIGEQLGFEIRALTCPNSDDPMRELAKGAAAVFALLLEANTLSVVSTWLGTLERKLQDCFYAFVEEHLSPTMIQGSLLEVVSKNSTGQSSFNVNENYHVSVSIPRSCIKLTYTMDDVRSSINIEFKSGFPLRPPVVMPENLRGCGVSSGELHAWMLKMSALLFGGSVNVWKCVMLFGRNMDEHFAGKEPCPICFSIVSATTNRLPDMRCAVCRNSLFHSDCLFSWWSSSGRTQCPLCKSPWVAR